MNWNEELIERYLKRTYGGKWKIEPEILTGQINEQAKNPRRFYIGNLTFSGSQTWAPTVVGRDSIEIGTITITNGIESTETVLNPFGQANATLYTGASNGNGETYLNIPITIDVPGNYVIGGFFNAEQLDTANIELGSMSGFAGVLMSSQVSIIPNQPDSGSVAEEYLRKAYSDNWYLVQIMKQFNSDELQTYYLKPRIKKNEADNPISIYEPHCYQSDTFGYKAQPKDKTPRMSLTAKVNGQPLPMDSRTIFAESIEDLSGYANFQGWIAEQI